MVSEIGQVRNGRPAFLGELVNAAQDPGIMHSRRLGGDGAGSFQPRALDSVAVLRATLPPMRFVTFFYGYFWFSHRTGGGETSA